MTQNLETADRVIKLILAIAVVISYFTKLITGPLALALLILSIIGLLIFFAKALHAWIFID